jgi:hypothetical protein
LSWRCRHERIVTHGCPVVVRPRPGRLRRHEVKTAYTEPKDPSIMDNDEAYVAYVSACTASRIEVVWVNTPRKSAEQVAKETGEK